MAVPVERLFEAFVDSRRRKKWLPDAKMSLQTSQPDRSARFGWEGGPTRVNVDFIEKGPSKSTVSVAHQRLAEAGEAQATKAMWRQRLAELKLLLES